MIKIHHATARRASEFGITLSLVENEVEASKDGCTLASAPQANVALDKAIAVIKRSHNEDDFEGEAKDDAEGDVDEEAGKAKSAKSRVGKTKAKSKTSRVNVTAKSTTATEPRGAATKRAKAVETVEQTMMPADDATDKAGRSVIKQSFRDRYKETGGNCGDDLAQRISKHVSVTDGNGKSRVDVAKLKALVERNGLEWKPQYDDLNPGLCRMTCANKLRALSRHGKTIEWK
jgi:hypothetical protein